MIIIFGYRTANQDEVPAILYLGSDGVDALRICETDPHPRIARLDNPQPRPFRHWTEEAAEAFANSAASRLPSAPTVEQGMAMLDHIKALEEELSKQTTDSGNLKAQLEKLGKEVEQRLKDHAADYEKKIADLVVEKAALQNQIAAAEKAAAAAMIQSSSSSASSESASSSTAPSESSAAPAQDLALDSAAAPDGKASGKASKPK